MEFLSFAKSTALTKRIICVMNFYKAVVTTSAPAYRTYLATQAKEWSSNIVSIFTILRWEREYRQCQNHICLDFRRRWTRSFLLDEPEIRIKIMDWIHKNCDKDGEPGITVTSFKHYINGEVLPNLPEYFTGIAPKAVVWETARKWLHSLGIKYQRINGKTGFADGHERPDVKAQRCHFVKVMSELGKESFLYLSPMTVERVAMWEIPQKVIEERIMEVREGEGAKVQLHVDERFHWTAAEERRGGPGIMITAFVNESIGWLKLSSQDMAAINAKRTIEGILPCKYFTAHKEDQALFIFDWSSGHSKYPLDALNDNCMNMKYGGTKGCNMWAATLEEDFPNSNMRVQEQLDDGSCLDPNNYVNKPKGIRQVLWERGLLKPDMTLDGKWVDGPGNKPVRDVSTSAGYMLSQCPDFLNQKSALQLQIETQGHRCEFLPKYHPERNPIELCWGWVKRWMRTHCRYTYESMLENLPIPMVDKLPLSIIRNFFRHARNYMSIYLLEATAMNAKRMIREYKSHMRPAPSEFNPGKPKYKPYGKMKDDIELGVWSPPSAEEGRSKCDLNLKPGVSKVTLEKIKERLLMSHTKYQWHLDDDDPVMADEVSVEETGEPEAESGQVDDDDGEDHDEFDLGDMW
eukprot:Em0001g932a